VLGPSSRERSRQLAFEMPDGLAYYSNEIGEHALGPADLAQPDEGAVRQIGVPQFLGLDTAEA
jgi:hypothetical protein